MTFDRTKRYAERSCECGSGCGLSWRVVPGQRSRRFHKDCPARLEAVRKAAREYQRQKAAEGRTGPRRVRQKATAGRTANDWCSLCAGLEHRRKIPKCPECGELHKPLEPLDIMDFARRSYEYV